MVLSCCRQAPPEAAAPTAAVATTPGVPAALVAYRLTAVGTAAGILVVEAAMVFRLAAVDMAIGPLVTAALRARQGAVAAVVVTTRPGLCLTAGFRAGVRPAGPAMMEAGMTLTGFTPIHPPMKRLHGDMLISSS